MDEREEEQSILITLHALHTVTLLIPHLLLNHIFFISKAVSKAQEATVF